MANGQENNLGSGVEVKDAESPVRRYLKFVGKFIAVIVGVFLIYILGMWAWQKYAIWSGTRAVQGFNDAVKRLQEEDYKRAMADTYGGKTPQETLRMYIEAVEKGDYELASKYFIGDYQERELKSSREMSDDKIQRYINLLKDAVVKLDIDGKYDAEKKYFSMYEPILVRMKIYPSGIWKIIEI